MIFIHWDILTAYRIFNGRITNIKSFPSQQQALAGNYQGYVNSHYSESIVPPGFVSFSTWLIEQ